MIVIRGQWLLAGKFGHVTEVGGGVLEIQTPLERLYVLPRGKNLVALMVRAGKRDRAHAIKRAIAMAREV